MPNFWKVVNDVIRQADVLLLLLDARLVEETRNEELEKKVRKHGKPLIYVITKSDLVKRENVIIYKKKLKPCVLVSAKERLGTGLLRQSILIESKRRGRSEGIVKVGVLGYPNVGKSSLINAMKGKKAASTSALSGHTKGMQFVKSDNRIMFLDSPGVISFREKDIEKHTIIGTIDYAKSKEPDLAVMDIIERFPGRIESYYDVEKNQDSEEIINDIAVKRKVVKKGNKPDMLKMARRILEDWQKGNIK